MLNLSNVSKAFTGRVLFEDVTLTVNRGDHVALVGPNGAGKSTLFSIILRKQAADTGVITLERGATVGYLPQETAAVGDETVLEIATGGAGRADSDPSLAPRAKRILSGLAFREGDFERRALTLSGGWVMRAHLARLLVSAPDLLMLDEPTNHRDLESLVWFQNYLKNYAGALMMISHDRAFLNKLTDSVLEIRHQRVNRYRGNYDDYLRQRADREARHLAAFTNQQREIAALQRFADRFRAKASKASQAQSKLKQIERMEKIAAPEAADRHIKIKFPQPPRGGRRGVTLSGIHFSYGTLTVYRGIDFEAERGQRIVLVGPNGAGKSTLLKLLAGVLSPSAGGRSLGHNVSAGYYSQNRVEMLDLKRTVLEEASDLNPPLPELTVRTVLGSFLFSGDDVFKRVGVLSGGEKSRLALVKLLLNPPILLLMDEPTPHLDMASFDALIGALTQYDGTLIFISHDVYFIRALAKTVLNISAGQLTHYAGDYDYYLSKTRADDERAALVAGEKISNLQPADAQPAADNDAEKKVSIFKTREQKKQEAREREERAKLRRAAAADVQRVEEEILQLEARQKELLAELQNPVTFDHQRHLEYEALTLNLEEANERWLSALARSEELA
ncbi:MAG: ABC-F family ATP-binding cassette domain-containing protein [Verrucomicrobiales bacterium]|jgi:ATP-binding cassette subfamily F protein 3|nr:ABC-F family ATP-binding cassette domain-containing protein [Verrucomicrobiales bacterium]